MPVIEVNDVYKKFRVYYDKGQSLKDRILFRNRNHYENRWVLKGISFEAEKGDVIGLIGQNGCGKSTLLKLMSKIMYPDQGSIRIEGRVSSLIELGAGFHPEMRGRENIYTNASIFGLSKKEIDARLDKIIAFSELQEFIDNPVRTYSSGMYMRLAFSVAINVDADVLLIDEILAVGDANFQAKCFERLRELKAAGLTIVIVTHSTGTIEQFCNKAIWIDNGVIQASGNTLSTIDSYLRFMNEKKYESMLAEETLPEAPAQTPPEAPADETVHEIGAEPADESAEAENAPEAAAMPPAEPAESVQANANRYGLRYVEILHAELLNQENHPTSVLKALEPITVEISYQVHKPLEEYVFGFSFRTLDDVVICGSNTMLDRCPITGLHGRGKIRVRFHHLPLITGKYILQIAVVDPDDVPMDFYRDYCHFDVVSDDRSVGLVTMEHTWEIVDDSTEEGI